MTSKTTRERVEKILTSARDKGERPNLRFEHLADLDLRGLDMRSADLTGAFLTRANLTGANLYGANLTGATLNGTNLSYAYLSRANLTDAYLGQANLTDADLSSAFLSRSELYRANLYGANLTGAYLCGASFGGANLACAYLTGLAMEGLPSGPLLFHPTTEDWQLTIGCWGGTIAELREMIAKDTDWPEAQGEEVEVRRPMLEAAANMCETYAAAHPNATKAVKAAADRWKITRGSR